jgi:colicin import membrane protein
MGSAGAQAPRPDWLEAHDPATILEREAAEKALEQIGLVKPKVMRQLLIEERACYNRFFVNTCLAEVETRRKDYERRYGAIEVRARQVIRDDEAVRKSEALASDIAQREAEADLRASEQKAAQLRAAQRQTQLEEKQTDRQTQLQSLQAEQAQRESKRAGMQADLEERQAQARQRESAASANAQARLEREAEHANRLKARIGEIAEQRSKALAKQQARDEEARKQAVKQQEKATRRAAKAARDSAGQAEK